MEQTAQVSEQQKVLLMDKLVGEKMEILIPQLMKLAEDYALEKAREKSPFRNALNVATELGSGIEVTKNFVRYQLGRTGANRMWSVPVVEGKPFAVALVEAIDDLRSDAKQVADTMQQQLGAPLEETWHSTIHRRLMQLYLGYLARYQAFLTREKGSK